MTVQMANMAIGQMASSFRVIDLLCLSDLPYPPFHITHRPSVDPINRLFIYGICIGLAGTAMPAAPTQNGTTISFDPKYIQTSYSASINDTLKWDHFDVCLRVWWSDFLRPIVCGVWCLYVVLGREYAFIISAFWPPPQKRSLSWSGCWSLTCHRSGHSVHSRKRQRERVY